MNLHVRFGNRLRKTKRAALAVSGMVAGTVIVGVALATIIVHLTGSVSSNEFIPTTTTTSTTTTTIPDGDGLQAAISATSGDCPAALAAGSMDLGAISFDLNTSAAGVGFLCVTNNGPGNITSLTIAAVTTASGEAGCSQAEGTVDPEGATCGSDGELEDVLFFLLNRTFNIGGDCELSAFFVPGSGDSLMQNPGVMFPGDRCEWEIVLALDLINPPTDDELFAASTDTVGFTLDVTGSG